MSDQRMERAGLPDRFTELPDSIRLQILSLLSRKDAIRTGTLSTKWKNSWRSRFPHNTTINVDEALMSDESQQQQLSQEIHDRMRRRHGENNKFEVLNLFFYPSKEHKAQMCRWIRHALLAGVVEASLDFSQGMGGRRQGRLEGNKKKFEAKESWFRINYLIFLRISYCKLNRAFSFRHFRALEHLFLHAVNINDAMMERLIANCLVLETLDIRECEFLQNIKMADPGMTRLKRFVVVQCGSVVIISINAPVLRSFLLVGGGELRVQFLSDNQSSLVDLMLVANVNSYFSLDQKEREELPMPPGLQFLEVLTLSNRGLQYIFRSRYQKEICMPYLREIQLILTDHAGVDLYNLFQFMRHCYLPGLEWLFIELPEGHYCPYAGCECLKVEDYRYSSPGWKLEDKYSYSYPQVVYKKLKDKDSQQVVFGKLRLIKMKNYRRTWEERRFVEYLISKAPALEALVLVGPHVQDPVLCRRMKADMDDDVFQIMEGRPPAFQVIPLCSKQEDHTEGPAHTLCCC